MSLPETERPPILFHSSRVSKPVLLIRKTRQTFLEVAGRAEECILNELRQLSLLLWVSSRTLHFFFHRWLREKKKKKGKPKRNLWLAGEHRKYVSFQNSVLHRAKDRWWHILVTALFRQALTGSVRFFYCCSDFPERMPLSPWILLKTNKRYL